MLPSLIIFLTRLCCSVFFFLTFEYPSLTNYKLDSNEDNNDSQRKYSSNDFNDQNEVEIIQQNEYSDNENEWFKEYQNDEE